MNNEISNHEGNKKFDITSFLDVLNNISKECNCYISYDTDAIEDYDKCLMILNNLDKKLNDNKMTKDNIQSVLDAIKKYKQSLIDYDRKNGKNLANSIGIYTNDLYKDSLHFFLELIQNADDAAKGIENASLKIELTKNNDILFMYTERGFNFSDILSITSIGNSTKKAKLDDKANIGEKGIGFKSLFALAESVNIKSKYFSFSIKNTNPNDMLDILVPAEVNVGETTVEDKKIDTVLKLVLRKELKENEKYINSIKSWIEEKSSCTSFANPFIFLQNLESITLKYPENHEKTIEIKRKSINEYFSTVIVGEQRYLRYIKNMEFGKKAIKSRWPYLKEQLNNKDDNFIIKRPFEICFPLNINEDAGKGKIYSYLPTTIEIDFSVLINLDVHLTASRGNITHEDFANESEWNNQVKTNLTSFLLDAYREIIEYTCNNVEDLKNVKDHLYLYLPVNRIEGTYSEELNNFFEEIIKQNIFMANDNKFKCSDEIIFFKLNNSNDNIYEVIYTFLQKSKGDKFKNISIKEKHIPLTKEWNQFIINLNSNMNNFKYDNKCEDIWDVLCECSGIKQYWNNTKDSEIINDIINQIHKNHHYYKDYCDKRTLEVIPCETSYKSNEFEIKSIDEIEKENKVLFIHSFEDGIEEDKENSVYVCENKLFTEKIWRSFLENIFKIQEYNLKNFFENEIKKYKDIDWNMNIFISFFQKTFPFYKTREENPYKGIDDYKIKKFIRNYYLPSCNYCLIKNGNEYSEDYVNEIENLLDVDKEKLNLHEFRLELLSIDDCEKAKVVQFLMFLGIKYKIEIENESIDAVSKKILENKKYEPVKVKNENRELNLDNLQTYYFKSLNNFLEEKKSINDLQELCQSLGLYKCYNNKEVFVLESGKISEINNNIRELRRQGLNTHDISDSRFCIIEEDRYMNIFKRMDVKNFTNSKDSFMNSFNKYGEEFIKDLRMMKILNKVFNVEYKWATKQPMDLSMQAYLSCYKFLEKENLFKLMEKGYIIKIPEKKSKNTLYDILQKYIDLEDFLIFSNIYNKYDRFKNIIITSCKIDEDYVCIKNKQQSYENKQLICKEDDKAWFIIKYNTNKSQLLIPAINALKELENESKLDRFEEKAIKDYFGELKENTPVLSELNFQGYLKYCEGLFFDKHQQNIEAIKNLPSIWNKKEILEVLSSPLILQNDDGVMEGYEYTCPICGQKSYSALNGMEFKRFINYNKESNQEYPYLYIVSCLNCNKMLTISKEVSIENLSDIMESFEKYYISDDDHVRNHSKMMTVYLKMKTYNDKMRILPMKISYLNMILYRNSTKKKY